MTHNPSFVTAAGATILVSQFVKQSLTQDFAILSCVANDQAIGISHESTEDAQLPGLAQLPASTEGNSCRVYGEGESCALFLGATVAAGDKLKPDANGRGIPAAAGQPYSAIARQAGIAGEKIEVMVERGVA